MAETRVLTADVAIVGGGPAGLAAALVLRQSGIDRVVVLERETAAGGVPRHCGHPPFGWREFRRILTGPAYAARLVAVAAQAGVTILTRHSVVALGDGALDVATPEGRLRVEARRILLATGIRETPRAARLLTGARPVGILNTGALQAFVHLQGLAPFRRPVIVGTELVGLSAVATCLSHGIRPVAVVERRDRPTARWPLGLFPRLAGIPMRLGTEIVDIAGAKRVEAVTLRGPSGPEETVPCDGLLLTGEFVPEAALVRASPLALDRRTDGPCVDQDGRTSDPRIYAAGNVLRAVETAGWSHREGARIGRAIAADLAGRRQACIRTVAVVAELSLKLVVPQRLALPAGEDPLPPLQIRVAEAARGRLELRAGERVLASRPVAALPERRILVDLAGLAIPEDATTLSVGIRP